MSSVARLERSFHQVPGEGIKERNSSREVHAACVGLGVWGWECGIGSVGLGVWGVEVENQTQRKFSRSW